MDKKNMGRKRKTSDEIAVSRIKKETSPGKPGCPTGIVEKEIQAHPGLNQKILTTILKEREIASHADINDVRTLYVCLEEYIKYCIANDYIMTNTGAYAACGLTRSTISNWMHGIGKAQSDSAYKEFALTISGVAAEYRESAMSNGKLNPIVGIWWQKVYDGYREDMEAPQQATNLLGEQTTAADVADHYDDMPE